MNKRISHIITNIKTNYWFFIGLVLSLLFCTPYLILGENSIITYHDQLDGEILTYIYNAKYLFSQQSIYPELMNGIPAAGLISPAPLFILLFRFFRPFTAFIVCQILVTLVAYISMYCLLREFVSQEIICCVVSLFFMMIPFYPVYGFCIAGQALLLYAVIQIRKRRKLLISYLLIVLYGACSSPVLVGYACVASLLMWSLVLLLQREKEWFSLLCSCFTLILTYCIFNPRLLSQLFGFGTNFVSHKTEVIHKSSNFFIALTDCLFGNIDYVRCNQVPIITTVITVIIFSFLIGRKSITTRLKQLYRWVLYGFLFQLICAVLYAIYHSEFVVAIRNQSRGFIHDFNADRLSWLTPIIWYLMLALSLSIVYETIQLRKKNNILKPFQSVLALTIASIAILGIAAITLLQSSIKPNIMRVLKGDSYVALTWQQFFAEDLFDEVEQIIQKPKNEYHVVSYGIYPSAAAYNGFYCLDGYSNNYDVQYKHKFAKVIDPELQKSEYLQDWFYNWGNRCYITVNELNYYTCEKIWGTVVYNFDIDTEELRDLGCDYLISAVYIMDAENKNMKLLTPNGIESEQSWYRLFVYELVD